MKNIEDLYTIYPVFAWENDENDFVCSQDNIVAVFRNKWHMLSFCKKHKDEYFIIFGGHQESYEGLNTHVGGMIMGIPESFHCKSDLYHASLFFNLGY